MAQLDPDACHELVEVERFDEVVVGPKAQKADAVGGRRARRDHDDRHACVARPDEGDELLAGQPRQHEVGEHHVEGVRGIREEQLRLAARKRLRAREAAARKVRGDDLVDVGVVLDDKNARGHGACLSPWIRRTL